MSEKAEWKRARRRSISNREFLSAVCDNDLEEVICLLDKGVDINFKDADGFTPLSLAAKYGSVKIVQLLLDKGASLEIKNYNCETPFDVAKRFNQAEIVKIFEEWTNKNLNSEAGITPTSQENQKQLSIQSSVGSYNNSDWNNAVHGNIYQLKVLMLFLYRGLTCQYSFRLGTEIKEARKFDDLVFEYTEDNTKVYRLLQAKHKIDETKKITSDKLFSDDNGDYSLVKYFLSYQACKDDNFFKDGLIKDVTICTNIDFDLASLEEAQIEVVKLEERDEILDVQSKSKNPARYKFTKSIVSRLQKKLKHKKPNLTIQSHDIEDFLDHLVFAVNQPNEAELGDIIKKEIGKEADPSTTEHMYNKFFIRMLDCFKGKRNFMSYNEGKQLFEEFQNSLFIWFNVHEPVKSFTGRSKQLKNMHKLLQTQENRLLCISGLGGVGKTEIVKKYVLEYSQCYENKIVWINAERYQTLVNSFQQLASDKLDISTTNADGKEKDVNSIVSQVYQYFSKSKSLFIFDNAEMYRSSDEFDSGIDRFLPSLPSGCNKPYVIITSRNQQWPESVKVQVLDGFTENEAINFISQTLKLKTDKQKEYAKQMGLKLQLLPLALQQAVAYIESQNEDPCQIEKDFQISDYLERFAGKSEEILNHQFPEHSDNKYSRTVFTTWNVTLDAIKKKENGHEALNLLNFLAYLLPNDISEEILSGYIENKEKLKASIRLLRQYSLIGVQNKMLSIHRLVQQVTRLKLIASHQEEEILERCVKAMCVDDVYNSKNINHHVSIWTHCKKYPALLKHQFSTLSSLMFQLTFYGRNKEALSMEIDMKNVFQESSLDDLEAQFDLSRIINNIGANLLALGEYEKALIELNQSYELDKVLIGPHDQHTLMVKCNIANVLKCLHRNDEAFKYFQEVLEDCELHLGEDHYRTIVAETDMASFLIEIGKYSESLSTSQKTYAKLDTMHGGDPQMMSMVPMIVKSHIAEALQHLNKHEEALKIYQEIYDFQKSNFTGNHPRTIMTRNSIAAILGQQDVNAAQEIFNDLYEECRNLHGENHHHTLQMRVNIATVLFEQGQKDAAFEIYNELLEIYRNKFGENHPQTLELQGHIATMLVGLEKYQQALDILEEIFIKQKSIFGLNHRQVESTLLTLAYVLETQGKKAESLKAHEELLQCQLTLLGENHERTLNARTVIAEALLGDKKYDAALKQFSKMYQIQKDSHGTNDPQTLAIKSKIGLIYSYKKQYDEAFSILKEVCRIREAVLEKKDDNFVTDHNIFVTIIMEHQENRNKQNEVLSIAEELIDKGIDVNIKATELEIILHYAINVRSMKSVKLLLKNGADVTLTTTKGNTALHLATLQDDLKIVEALLENIDCDKLKELINAKTFKSGSTALHVAAKNSFLEITKYLLARGATYDLKNNDGQLAEDLATDQCTKDLLKNVRKHFELASSGEKELINMLEQCAEEEYLAAINARNNQGYNLMQVVEAKNHQELAKSLKDLNNKYSTRSAKLLGAAKRNDITEVEKLIKEGTNVNVKENGGWTPLHYATNVNNEKMVDILLSAGAKVHCITNTGKFTPLHLAASKKNIEIVRLLLQSHSSIELLDAKTEAKGSTALHIAVQSGQYEMVKLLSAHSANYQMKNKDGQTPLDLANNEKIRDLFKLVDELFDDLKKEKRIEEKLTKLENFDMLITVARVRNGDDCTLMDKGLIFGGVHTKKD